MTIFKVIAAIGTATVLTSTLGAEDMKGVVLDMSDKPLKNVLIKNVYTGQTTVCDTSGKFFIQVETDQLVLFMKPGFDTARVRIKKAAKLPYYTINMDIEDTTTNMPVVVIEGKSWYLDSLERAETYASPLGHFSAPTGLEAIQHATDFLSKKNRQIWKFQKNYQIWEADRYIDYQFNDAVIGRITKLGVDSVPQYMHIYRPSYAQLRNWTKYDYYTYLKNTVNQFRYDMAQAHIYNKNSDSAQQLNKEEPFIDYHDK